MFTWAFCGLVALTWFGNCVCLIVLIGFVLIGFGDFAYVYLMIVV